MHRISTGTAIVAATLALAMPATASAATRCHGTVRIAGGDRGTFTTMQKDATHVLTEDLATGWATNVGRYAISATEVIDSSTGAFLVTDGHFTITSRRGTLVGSYSGTAAGTAGSPVITYHVTGPVLGGTGRFAGATGSLTFDGVANLATGQLCDRVSGSVSRRGEDASSRLKDRTTGSTEACNL